MKKAVLLYTILLTIGFSKDLVELGLEAYSKGDYNKAVEIFTKTCNDGNNGNCYNLGLLYINGQGVKQDYNKAAKLYEKACNNGYNRGCFNLGAFYLKGKGAKQDYHIAKEYFYKACELGLQPGCDVYKKLNEKGL